MFIVTYRKYFFAIAILGVLFALFSITTKGFNVGMDFVGGSIIEVSYDTRPDIEVIKTALTGAGFENARVQMAGESDVIVKTTALTEVQRQELTKALAVENFAMEEKRFSSIGPTIGKELRTKAWIAITLVIIGIVLFLAFAFRKVSEPIASWKYGAITTVTLLFDILIPVGAFTFLGKEIDALFIVALLAIMGLSVHDTIVVFDRIRENLKLKVSNDFPTVVGKSLGQTFTRSINTSVTIMLVLGVIFFFGPASTKDFSLLLWIGIFVGTYSSIFLASPLLVTLEKRQNKA
ncbi:MAG: protein translocase subunit SecF [Patescibacteria group bacterium]